MKHIYISILAILIVIFLAGCSFSSKHTNQNTPMQTITTSPTFEPTFSLDVMLKTTAEPTVTPSQTPVPSPKTTPKPTAKPTAKPIQKPSGSTVVQMADHETGISWDGKSAILYTYEDGTTGTEKRVGAKYEAYPGVIYTIEQADVASPSPSSPVQTSVCSDCGKPDGDGTNGTCVQWLMKDVDCPYCGEHVPVRTCHTCEQ